MKKISKLFLMQRFLNSKDEEVSRSDTPPFFKGEHSLTEVAKGFPRYY